ncbi:hypothetical protein CA51_46690 [Rosistilla oblonga]|nr:hypothetical protein CA51_46690 [Rosistilla oblonga]
MRSVLWEFIADGSRENRTLTACRFNHNELLCISRLGVSPGLAASEPGLTPKRLIKPTRGIASVAARFSP